MSDQLDFDSYPVVPPEGHVGPAAGSTIRREFLKFHSKNPHVYDELVRMCRKARDRGVRKLGIGMLWETLRWQELIRTGSDEFKLNNNYRSYYARKIMIENEDLKGIFETRRLHL